jgi:SpoVK/Ycf46/Vps4 family AAA+-type ATPase
MSILNLIESLDNEQTKNNIIRKQLLNKNNYSDVKVINYFNIDKRFKWVFPNYYEKKFTTYLDPDKCDEGFSRKRIRKRRLPKINVEVNANIEKLEDLVKLINDYPKSDVIDYSIRMEGLYNIKNDLKELISFVGLDELKANLLDQIIYFIQQPPDDYLHTVLYGPPGTGKTEVAKILGNIYTKLGILRKGTFKKVTRADFVAGYLGQTAIKTRQLIENNLGGVIFIDEAYSMGNQEKRDSFSKEALDTLCELLSDYKNDIMVIIAGYREELDNCFFSYNPGLASRFAWQFEIKEYTPDQLSQILRKKVEDYGWVLSDGVANEEWFKENMDFFKNYGRDVENLFSKCKICHYRRIFGKSEGRHVLTMKDLENGFEKTKKFNADKNENKSTPSFMYT